MNFTLQYSHDLKTEANADLIISIMQNILKREVLLQQQEHFWIVGLDFNNNLKFIELAALGRSNIVNIDFSHVFRIAIYRNASRLIFVHNHSSGDLYPSQSDRNTTEFLVKIAELLKIDILDHFIISADSYFSFADQGILDEIRLNDAYRIFDKQKFEVLKSELLEEGKLEGISQGRKSEKHSIANSLLQHGIDKDLIIKATGLDPQLV